MRFHHSTRRGRNRLGQAGGGNHHSASVAGPGAGNSCGTGGKFGGHPSALSNRWAQLSYCRQTNLHFNRRLPVELPDEMRQDQLMRVLSDQRKHSVCKQKEQQQDLLVFSSHQPADGAATICSYDTSAGTQDNHHHHHHQIEMLEQLDKLKLGVTMSDVITSKHQSKQASSSSSSKLDMNKLDVNGWSRDAPHPPEWGAPPQATLAEREQPASRNSEQRPEQVASSSRVKLDLESARAKLIAQVDKHPFWSNKAARRMRLLELTERQVYIYELTSYCERRDLEWRYKPYRGGKLSASSATATIGTSKRPVISSVSELAVGQARRNLMGGGGDGVRRAAASQPASPPAPPTTPSGDCNPQRLMLLASSTAAAQRHAKFEFVFPGSSELAASNAIQTRGQSMRRSCSSATSSPAKGAAADLLTGSNTGAHSLTFSPPLTPPGLLLGTPRPVPSPEFVWSIEPPEHLRPQPFASYVHTSEVPGTSFLKKCHGCEGRGRLKCSSCYGVGYEVCLSCTGKGSLRTYASLGSSGRSLGPRSDGYLSSGGRGGGGGGDPSGGAGSSMWDNAAAGESRLGASRYDEPGGITSSTGGGGGLSSSSEMCASCSGMGQKRCWICGGRSYIICTACAGTGTLRCHLNLNITYLNHRDEMFLNNSDGIIPRERLRLTTGSLLADEIGDRLEPIAYSPAPRDGATSRRPAAAAAAPAPTGRDKLQPLGQATKPNELSQLNAMSARLLEKHAHSYLGSERLIKQRHKVTQIECFKIDWEFRNKRGHFVVYGNERRVYIAKYPFKSICNIT